jgi:regulator of sigma E protease
VIEVLPGTPAEQAGLLDDDKITHIEGEPIADWETMRAAIKRRPGLATRIAIERAGRAQTIEVTPSAEGVIGVKPVMERRPMGLGRSLARAAIEPLRVVQSTFIGWVRIFTGTERSELAGPVAISREVRKAQERGAADAFYLVGLVAAYAWPAFVILEAIFAAATWRDRRHKPPEGAARP